MCRQLHLPLGICISLLGNSKPSVNKEGISPVATTPAFARHELDEKVAPVTASRWGGAAQPASSQYLQFSLCFLTSQKTHKVPHSFATSSRRQSTNERGGELNRVVAARQCLPAYIFSEDQTREHLAPSAGAEENQTYLHELCAYRLNVVVQEIGLQVVHTQLQGPQALADQRLRAIESRHQGVHEHGQVGQEGAQPHGHSEAKLHEEVLHVLLVQAALQHVQPCGVGGARTEGVTVQAPASHCTARLLCPAHRHDAGHTSHPPWKPLYSLAQPVPQLPRDPFVYTSHSNSRQHLLQTKL